MAGAKNHDYHILPPDIWPLVGSLSALTFTSGMVLYMHELPGHWLVLGLGIAGLIATFFSWFSNIVKEARYSEGKPWNLAPGVQGAHGWHSNAYSPDTGLVYVPLAENYAM